MPRDGRRSVVSLALMSTLVAAVSSARLGSAVPTNHMLDNSPGQLRTHVNPMIRSYADKVVAVWNDTQTQSATEPRIHYAVSTDSGATFTDLGAPPAPGGTGRWLRDPQLAVDADNGTFFLVAQGTPAGIWATRGLFSGSVLNWSAPVLVRASNTGAIIVPGLLALENSVSGNVLHFLYQTGTGTIEYQRSTDGNGAVWSAPVTLSSPADAGAVAYPQLATGPVGAVYAAWAGPLGLDVEPIRVRASTDQGASWGSEQTVTTRMNPAIPGSSAIGLFADPHRPPFSLAVNRAAGSATHGQVALAWGEPWDFTDEPFPALTMTVLRNEVEPNDNIASATPFNIGDALLGMAGVDIDYWSVTLSAGAPILIWADSTDTPGVVHVYVLGPDGWSQDNGVSGGPSAVFAFRAPSAGTYMFYVEASPTSHYRVRTRAGTPAPGEGRDVRDIAVAFSNGGPWTTRHLPFGPIGYDDYEPTIGFGADGLDYVTWYDLSRGTLSGHGRLVVARNLTGADPVPSPPVTVSDAESGFNDLQMFFPPGLGCANDTYGVGRRVFLAWTDLRDQATNAYAASLATDAFPIAFPNDTSATAGTVATLHGRVLNRNPEFQEKVSIRVTGARAWPGALVVRDSVPVAATGVISIPIAIPDTAAAGVYPLTIQYERQSGLVLGSRAVNLTIQAVTGVGDSRLAARLDPIAPNPTTGPTRLAFSLAQAGEARLEVFGIRGERVRTLVRGPLPAGERSLRWDGRDDAGHAVHAGLYFVALESGTFRAVRPLVVLK
jgi:FlgD Ig-like domain